MFAGKSARAVADRRDRKVSPGIANDHEAAQCPVQWKFSSLARRANGLDGRRCCTVEKTGHPIRFFLAQGRVDEVVGAAAP